MSPYDVSMPDKKLSRRDSAFWSAYLQILSERTPLVDKWSDGTTSWHPRVVQKLLWYSGVPNTMRNRSLAYNWLMRNCAHPAFNEQMQA